MSNKKRGKISNTQSRILKILIEGYMHFFSKHEICLLILTTIPCNFRFVNTHTHIWYDQITTLLLVFFYFVYKIVKDYNFLQGNLLKFFLHINNWGSES